MNLTSFKEHIESKLPLFVILILGLFIQFQLIKSDPILGYDDKIILKPIMDGHYPWDLNYYKGILSGIIWDFQPIRDLTFSIDFILSKYTGFKFYHLQNFFWWLCISYFLDKTFQVLNLSFKFRLGLLLVFSFYPIFWISVSWISARKHLLAAFFILLPTFLIIKNKFLKKDLSLSNQILIYLSYILSILSQPINILWPIFFIYFQKSNIKKYATLVTGINISGLLIILVNFYYYKYVYSLFSILPKFASNIDHFELFSLKILSIGRSFFQIFIPIWPTPTPYSQGSILNIIGIILLVLFIFLIYKLKRNDFRLFLLFISLPFILVFTVSTNIFGSDTYLITPGIGFFIILALCLRDYFSKIETPIFIILLLISFFCFYKSSEISKTFQSQGKLFSYAYKIEPTPFNLRTHLTETHNNKEYNESLKLALRLIEWDPYGPHVDKTFSSIIYSLPQISILEKIKIYQAVLSEKRDLNWTKYHLSASLAQQNNFLQSYNLLNELKTEEYFEFEDNMSVVLAEKFYFCKMSEVDCNKTVMEINSLRNHQLWNQSSFEKRLQQLKIHFN